MAAPDKDLNGGIPDAAELRAFHEAWKKKHPEKHKTWKKQAVEEIKSRMTNEEFKEWKKERRMERKMQKKQRIEKIKDSLDEEQLAQWKQKTVSTAWKQYTKDLPNAKLLDSLFEGMPIQVSTTTIDPVIKDAIRFAIEESEANPVEDFLDESFLGAKTITGNFMAPLLDTKLALLHLNSEEIMAKKSEDERRAIFNAMFVQLSLYTVLVNLHKEKTCASQRISTEIKFNGRLISTGGKNGQALKASFPISSARLSDVRWLAHKPIDFEFFRMPLLAIGCRTSLFGVLFNGEKTRIVENTFDSLREAFVAIVACPTAFLRHSINKKKKKHEAPAIWNDFAAGFEYELFCVRDFFWPRFEDMIGDSSVANFHKNARQFFVLLVEFTFAYVNAYWRYAMILYGYVDEYNQFNTLALSGEVPLTTSFSLAEQNDMRRIHTNATAFRKDAFPMCEEASTDFVTYWKTCDHFESEKAYKAHMQMPLAELFSDLYAVGNPATTETPCVALGTGENVGGTGAFLRHALSDCVTLDKHSIMLPQHMTLDDLHVHWVQMHTLITKKHRFLVTEILNVYSATETVGGLEANGKEEEVVVEAIEATERATGAAEGDILELLAQAVGQGVHFES